RGDDCTFETLAKAFRIRDKSVQIMGQIVHDADLFDEKFGRREGFGIDEVMKGWAQQNLSDAQLLDRGMELAEGLYHSLRRR
ncbi:MAG TPA: chromate resistance protein ChrB domain-containing protein, partial [Terriglobia bacterium]|nr:chromate resistance protein ChrB domain-containing protein [Terriglobia bacterium]